MTSDDNHTMMVFRTALRDYSGRLEGNFSPEYVLKVSNDLAKLSKKAKHAAERIIALSQYGGKEGDLCNLLDEEGVHLGYIFIPKREGYLLWDSMFSFCEEAGHKLLSYGNVTHKLLPDCKYHLNVSGRGN